MTLLPEKIIPRVTVVGLAFLLVSGCGGRGRITEKTSFLAANAFSDSSAGSNCDEIVWATDSILVATARNKQIQGFDPDSGKELWGRKFDRSIEAITCNSDHVYVALEASYPHQEADSIRRLDLRSGADSTPEGIPQPFLVHALVWSLALKALCVLEHEGLWIYSADLLSVATRIPYSGTLPIVTSDGKSVLLAERSGSCTSIDLKAGTAAHIHGPPHKGRDNMIVMDAPFLSNAFHSTGGPLVRIIDNSWATGRIYFHNTPKEVAIQRDSKNGHAVAAIHWPTQQLAVSGTGKNLLLFSTSGAVLAEIGGATTERTYALAFSSSGSKIATLSSDGRIKVFKVP
jgi:WD40 repeat protein